MKRWLSLIAALIIVAFGASTVGFVWNRRAKKKDTEMKREAGYQSVLSGYSKDLRPGITRKLVEDYLQAKGIPFQQGADADLAEVGQEEGPWFCNGIEVYVAFEFAAAEPHDPWGAYASDVLKRISILRRAERCL